MSISDTGFSIRPSRIKSLLEIPYPTTKKAASAVNGVFNFYVRTIPRLQACLRPIHEALSGNKDFKLTPEIKLGLDRLKSYIREGVGVSHLTYDNPPNRHIFLACDSSLLSVGYVVGNVTLVDDIPTDVSFSHFGSKTFDKVTINMSSRSRELVGVSKALEDMQDLLPPSLSFIIFVDHLSLTRIFSKTDLGKTAIHTRIRTAYSILLNYPNVKLMHLSGKSDLMSMADGLSRVDFGKATKLDIENIDSDIVKVNAYKISPQIISKERFDQNNVVTRTYRLSLNFSQKKNKK